MKKPRLGVNIDHVATLRQARGEAYPSLVDAAIIVVKAGADQITIHLREDRRHIQDIDVPAIKLVTDRYGVPLNFEMSANEDILNIAIAVKPQWICLVPEKRKERTTEGGLDLINQKQFEKIKSFCKTLKEKIPGVKISLFIESEIQTLERASLLDVEAVEIHTGDYAADFLKGDFESHLEKFKTASLFCRNKSIGFHAGHGLTDESLIPLLKLKIFEEYNIGHWIICQAVFEGLEVVTKRLKQLIEKE